MPALPELRTNRLLLRPWRESDREPFAALNADPRVMEFFPAPLSREESDELLDRLAADGARHGVGLWAVEAPGIAPFLGFVGLANVRFMARFMPAVEVGWRLAAPFWGHGYATEAAQASLAFGFERLGLAEIITFTVPTNVRSRRVMERLRFHRNPADDFDHQLMPDGHPLQRHVLYRLKKAEWEAQPPPGR